MMRRLTAADAAAVARIEATCFSQPWSEAGIRAELENPLSELWGIGEEELVAYGGWQCVAGEGYVLNVAVLPEARRRGLGRALVGQLLCRARARANFLSLEVRESNRAAIALYASLGFETVGRRRDFYSHPTEDARIMTCFFGQE